MRVILCEDDPQQRRFLQSTILQNTSFQETNIELVLCAAKPEEVMTPILPIIRQIAIF